jgi:hypothetical protein
MLPVRELSAGRGALGRWPSTMPAGKQVNTASAIAKIALRALFALPALVAPFMRLAPHLELNRL